MKHRVVWTPGVESALTALWLASRRRNAVTSAASRLDQQLADDPFAMSESRISGIRIAFEPPLARLFEVDAETATARMLAVWAY